MQRRHRVGGILHDEPQQGLAIEMEQVGNRGWAGAIVECSGASAENRLTALARGVGEVNSWREIERNVVEKILPLISQACSNREVMLDSECCLQ